MGEVRLLPGEHEEATLRPHPVSFLPRYLAAGFPAIWGLFLLWLFHTAWWGSGSGAGQWFEVWRFLYGNTVAAHAYAVAGLAVAGAAVSVVAIRWRIFWGYLLAGAVSVVASQWLGSAEGWLPWILVAAGALGIGGAEASRRSHRFVLTNLRIVFQGGFLVSKERQMRYEAITDLDGTQGPLGRMLDYGTIIPVTQSGFGLGEDSGQAGIMVGGGASKGGIAAGLGVGAGGGRSVQTGRARSFHQLTGIKPYGDTKHRLESLIQAATTTPYLREQVDLQRRMVDALEKAEGKGA